MRRIYHPTFDLYQDVDDQAAKDWQESGWLDVKPENCTAINTDPPVAPGDGAVYAVDVSGGHTEVEMVDLTPSNDPPDMVTR